MEKGLEGVSGGLAQLLRPIFGGRKAGPAPERAGEGALAREAEEKRHFGRRLLRVLEIAQRELAPRVVHELEIAQLGFRELPLEGAPAHVQHLGHALLGNLTGSHLVEERRLAARWYVVPVERRELSFEYAVERGRELAVRYG